MNLDNIDLAALDRDLQEFARQQKQRGWFRRNWLWFVPTLFLAMMIGCCGCFTGIFYFALGQLYDSEVFKTAMRKIEADETIRAKLGQPITKVQWPLPAGRIETTNGSGEADIRWEIEGPLGRARAHTQARLSDKGWELVILEVTLADGEKVSLLTENDGAGAAPLFDPGKSEGGKPEEKKPESNGPPPVVNMPVIPE